ncbi:MAG: ester cyclase [Dehalococcoidia bacterium]|nr:ester cyclase [Dehalococcoidia bacterium]
MNDTTNSTSSVTQANKAIVLQIYERILTHGELQLAGEVFAPDIVDHRKFPGLANGLENVLAGARVNREAFPDMRFTVEALVAEEDLVMARWVMHGTFLGEFMGRQPTGTSVEWRGITQFRLTNGKVVERWLYADELQLLGNGDSTTL